MILLPVTAVVTAGILLAVFWGVFGREGLSLLEGLYLVNSRFVGEYDQTQVVDSALSGMVEGLGDRWSYYLTEEEYVDILKANGTLNRRSARGKGSVLRGRK